MSGFKKRRLWDSQPQESVALGGGLAENLFFLETPTQGLFDKVSGGPLTATSAPVGPGPGGLAWQLSGGSGSVSLPHTTKLNVTNNFTLFGLVRSTSASGAQYIINKNYDGSAVPYSLSIGGNTATDGIAQFNGAWKKSGLGGKAIRGDGLVHLVVGTCTGGLFSYYVDGVLYGQAGAGTLASGTGDLYVGRYQNDAASFVGDIYIAGGLNVALAPGQVAHFNPWELFAPRSIWIPVSAGGNTSIAGALGTAVASGLTGTVNANRTIAGALGTAAATGFTGTVSNSTDTTITGALGVATATGFAGTVGANRGIAGALGTAVASGFTGTVANSNDTTVAGNLGTAAAIGYQAFVNANRTIAGSLGTAVASGYTGTVQNGAAAEFSKNANLYLDIGSDLSILLGNPRMPAWNTAGRPAAPLDYVYGFNTDTSAIEVWTGSAWV